MLFTTSPLCEKRATNTSSEPTLKTSFPTSTLNTPSKPCPNHFKNATSSLFSGLSHCPDEHMGNDEPEAAELHRGPPSHPYSPTSPSHDSTMTYAMRGMGTRDSQTTSSYVLRASKTYSTLSSSSATSLQHTD